MPRVTVYTTEPCGYCRTAKALLQKRGIAYEEINLAKDAAGRAKLAELTGMMTFPQVIIDGKPIGGYQELVRLTGMMTFPQVVIDGASIGGYQELVALDRQGELAELAAAA